MLPIAATLFGKNIITETEYDVSVDPSAEHSTAVTRTVLKAVRRAIFINPDHLDTLKGVLIDIGEPISALARHIGKAKYFSHYYNFSLFFLNLAIL